MSEEEEDTEVKIYWGECNDYTIEQWMEYRKKLYQYVGDNYKPVALEVTEKPWLIPGANISDWFNFDFDEESWNEFLLNQIALRQAKILEKEQQMQQIIAKKKERKSSSTERNERKHHEKSKHKKHDEFKKSRR
ncbi:unnamed protein product [Blepharisma stoltei]|uniref:Pre-mRNA polyadenylation factor Fip1 domain-containing protein n=1 Tax=Blepharisma stoltei TaxID=1481888 RepID=A0AAU9KQ61_9CILI|nr:unnamed protein product [Blepharisma stoltei]